MRPLKNVPSRLMHNAAAAPRSARHREGHPATLAPGPATLPLCSGANASPFWIMLLLVSGTTDHGIIVPDERNHRRFKRGLAEVRLGWRKRWKCSPPPSFEPLTKRCPANTVHFLG